MNDTFPSFPNLIGAGLISLALGEIATGIIPIGYAISFALFFFGGILNLGIFFKASIEEKEA